ncbi:MAG: histidine ammonia-lyase [bacterium]|nr:histidine ammonia-lyase [bacterium]
MAKKIIELGPDKHITPEDVATVAHDPGVVVSLSKIAKKKVIASRKVVERIIERKDVVYGLTTGFGSFKDKFISAEHNAELQINLIRSHSSGVGEPFAPEIIRAALVARLNSLAQGHSGVRLEFLEFFINLLNKNIIPVVPCQGSVGASGDLAPLSHMGLVALGEGEIWYGGKIEKTAPILRKLKIKPVRFQAKEGLAWNNGTSVLTGIAALVIDKATYLAGVADIGCALTLEAVQGVSTAYYEKIHELRKHPGQITVAAHIRNLIKESKLVDSAKNRIQDSYSLRCAPQVHGAVRDSLTHATDVVTRELNAVTDNPIVFENPDRAISGGNFHGEPVAIAMDLLSIAIAELANISERRTAKLVDPSTSQGLPLFLIKPERGGLHNGMMIPQYVAAALVSENKVLAHPASVDSIPTSANQEDHVSMGMFASRKALIIVKNTENVLAIELLNAAQAIDFRDPKKLGVGTKKAYESIRKVVPTLDKDRILSIDIEKVAQLLRHRKFFKK